MALRRMKLIKRKKPGDQKRSRGAVLLPALATLLLVACLVGGIVCHSIRQGETSYEITFYQLTSDRVSRNIRFAVLSDLHLREYGEDNSQLVKDIMSLKPDVILLAGDMVTYGVEGYDGMLSLCRQLAEIAPTFAVMGNHEDEKIFLDGDRELPDRFEQTGVAVLRNRSETVKIGGDTVEIVGLSGSANGYRLYGGQTCMEGLAQDYDGYRVVMAHVPTLFPQELKDFAFDLGVAGHTHGGIVRLPKFGGLYSDEEGLLPIYDGGMYEMASGARLMVSRGMGTSGRVPRIFNLPQLVVIDVNWY